VQGLKDLVNLMEMQVNGSLDADIIVTSIDTLTNFFRDYAAYPEIRERYPYAPWEFFEKMGIGLAVLDEGHQAPHKVMRLFCYTNIPKFMTLSATVETRDAFTNKIYSMMYPLDQRHGMEFREVYIGV